MIKLQVIENPGNNSVSLQLTISDKIHVLHPDSIKVFSSSDPTKGRTDQLMERKSQTDD